MINRNLILLVFCQLISATGTIVMVTLGGIIGAELSSNPALSTLPVSMWVLATAATTIPAALLMRRIGRPLGFALAAMSAAAAVLIAAWALQISSFAGYLLAAGIFGINLAFSQQYRFAAIESTTQAFAGRAVSLVLIGSIGGALLGPMILRATTGGDDDPNYGTTMLTLAVMYVWIAIAALCLRRTESAEPGQFDATPRSLPEILKNPVYAVAVMGGAAGFGVMVFVMTATPLSMHTIDGFSLDQTSDVIRAHVLAMYLPSFVTGFLIDRYGVINVMIVGAVALLSSLIVGMTGHALHQYWITLILLGVGWNLMFVGGTTMLTYAYTAAERFRAQAMNEFCVFGLAAAGSLLAGTIMYGYGWYATVIIPIPLLLAALVALISVRYRTGNRLVADANIN